MSKNAISCPTCGEPSPSGSADAPTHCEWCGAEYPLPGEDEPPRSAPAADEGEPNRPGA
jgi:hypothetical protein